MSNYYLWETVRSNKNEAIIDDVSQIIDYYDDIMIGKKQICFPNNMELYLTEAGDLPDNFLISGVNALLFSERLLNLLLDNGVDSFDFYPCRIHTYPYYLIVIRDFIYCLDKDNSDLYFMYDDPGGEIDYILSVSVNETALDKDYDILFRLGEGSSNVLVHKRIKDLIGKARMTGMYFTPADGSYPVIEADRQEEGWLYKIKEHDYSYILEDDDSYCLNKNFPVRKYEFVSMDDE